jgi:hypothetical protein
MEQMVEKRLGMPRSVIVTPVLVLVAGAMASVALWVLLNRDAPRLIRVGAASTSFMPARAGLQP